MARRSQCSSAGDNPLDPNYLPPHYREEYRLAVDALVEEDLEGYYEFLLKADVVDFLSSAEIEYIQRSLRGPQYGEHPEQRFLEEVRDGSSDTYWPLHSDLDAPGLDLGWPQIHPFIGPTEVTTLVNPPEPDMPSIKEQARRLIKNATQVVAIAMDVFTDVDIFADILTAAMRNVAVYVLLDKENVHHFVNMVSNCRVDLSSIQSLRVRTVSGITYHCRSGKSFSGQMIDRFLLTDCRAVLSGNYSYMWSFEKLHRCMAHLFFGQLVSTFDEEFRILFAQSEPLMIDNMLPPVEDLSNLQKRKFSCERPLLYREPKRYQSLDTAHPDEWAKHSHDDRTDWRMMPHKRQEVPYGPADVYGRFLPQQSGIDLPFDQCPSRIAMMENPAFKRHSYAEGVHGRYSSPNLQPQGAPELEDHGQQFHMGQQPHPDYSSYDRFWNQDFNSADQYSELGLPQEAERHENFDPVLNYLSSTRNADFERGSEKIPPVDDLQLSSSRPRRLSLGQPYACQTSPTPSNQSDQKHFFLEPSSNRKDPSVKRGLRNWRISSFLSAHDNPGDDGLPSAPPNASDPFEGPSDSSQQTASGIDLAVPKIPNVREFKIPALPRTSQMPSYAKTTAREQPKKAPDQATAAEYKSTPTPSESSSTTEGEKMEEAEPKPPRTIQREESFRRKHNAAVQRSSRLRSSLIFSSLDQQNTAQDKETTPGQQDEDSDKNEADLKKLPYMSQVFGQRRSTAREPFEWSRFLKSSTFDNSATDTPKADGGDGKTDDKDSERDEHSKDLPQKPDGEQSSQPASVDPMNSAELLSTPSKSSEPEGPKTDQPVQPQKPLFTAPVYVDMNDPDKRLMFFKELAAKRKAEKAAEAKVSISKPANDIAVNKEQDAPKERSEEKSETSLSQCLLENAAAKDAGKTESSKFMSQSSDQSNAEERLSKTDSPQSPRSEENRTVTDPEKHEPKSSQSESSLHVSAETGTPEGKEGKLSNSAECERGPVHPSTPDIPVPSVAHGSDETHLDSTSQDCSPLTCSQKIPSSWENHTRPVQSWTSESGSGSGSAPLSTPAKTEPPYFPPEDSRSTSKFSALNGKEDVNPSASSISQSQTELTENRLHPVSTLTSMTVDNDVPESQTENSPEQAAPPSELHLTPATPAPQTVSASPPLTDTVLTTEDGQTQRPSDYFSTSSLLTSDSDQTPSQETSRPTESDLLYKTPESEPSSTAPSPESPVPPSTAPTESPVPSSTAPTESPVPSSTAPEESPVLPSTAPEESPVPSSTAPTESPVPSSTAPEESPVLPSTAPEESPVPSSTAPEESPVPSSTAPEESPVPSSTAPEESPVPSSTAPSESPVPSFTAPSPESPVPSSTAPEESPVPSSTAPEESPVPSFTASSPESPVPSSTAPSESPVPSSTAPEESPVLPSTAPSESPVPPSTAPSPESPVPPSTAPSPESPVPSSTAPSESPVPSSTAPEESPVLPSTAPSPESPVPSSTAPSESPVPSSTAPSESPVPSSTAPSPESPVPSSTAPSESPVPSSIAPEESPVLPSTASSPESPVPAVKGYTNSQNEVSIKSEVSDCDETVDTIDSHKTTDQVCSGTTSEDGEVTSQEVVPPSHQSKQQKSPQSRYHSSTANVLSSSNLRDDTKLLLEQISANSQSRNEATKESAVTDDDKEDEADKKVKRDQSKGIRTLSRGPPKSSQERDKLLERIQSMRKERKVYSRFEMAP